VVNSNFNYRKNNTGVQGEEVGGFVALGRIVEENLSAKIYLDKIFRNPRKNCDQQA